MAKLPRQGLRKLQLKNTWPTLTLESHEHTTYTSGVVTSHTTPSTGAWYRKNTRVRSLAENASCTEHQTSLCFCYQSAAMNIQRLTLVSQLLNFSRTCGRTRYACRKQILTMRSFSKRLRPFMSQFFEFLLYSRRVRLGLLVEFVTSRVENPAFEALKFCLCFTEQTSRLVFPFPL